MRFIVELNAYQLDLFLFKDMGIGGSRLGVHHLQLQASNRHIEIQVAIQPLALQWPLVCSHTEVDHVAPRESGTNSMVDIKSCAEDALGITDVSTMADRAILRI